jgi:hypothetical protein
MAPVKDECVSTWGAMPTPGVYSFTVSWSSAGTPGRAWCEDGARARARVCVCVCVCVAGRIMGDTSQWVAPVCSNSQRH